MGLKKSKLTRVPVEVWEDFMKAGTKARDNKLVPKDMSFPETMRLARKTPEYKIILQKIAFKPRPRKK